jgi:membrane protein implicated in regulation of membrane protease activity
MIWANLYLVCFLVGAALSLLSLVSSAFHLPHLHLHLGHGAHLPTAHAGDAAHGVSESLTLPIVNFATITAFMTWFGAAGYLLTQYSTLVVVLIVIAAAVVGVIGAGAIFFFIARVLLPHDRELDPADYDRVGALARVISSIREGGGTGEIIFSLAGARQTCGARSESGDALARGTEVVITRYEHGIAYVRRFEELSRETDNNSGSKSAANSQSDSQRESK